MKRFFVFIFTFIYLFAGTSLNGDCSTFNFLLNTSGASSASCGDGGLSVSSIPGGNYTVSITGPNGPYNFTNVPLPGSLSTFIGGQNGTVGAQGGTYNVTINGCTHTATVPVSGYTLVASPIDSPCACNGSITLSVNITNPSGNIVSHNYTLVGVDVVYNQSNTTGVFTNLCPGTYNGSVVLRANCSGHLPFPTVFNGSVNNIQVNFNPSLGPQIADLTASPSGAVCAGTPVQLSVGLVINAQAPITWNWFSTPPSILPNANPIIVTPAQTTIYDVSITDGQGCLSNTLSIKVDVNPNPPASIASNDHPNFMICLGQSITLTALPSGYDYQWTSPSTNTQSITVSPTSNTTYTVTVIDGSTGCKTSVSQLVTVNTCCTLSQPSLGLVQPANCNANNGVISIDYTGGNGQVYYSVNGSPFSPVLFHPFQYGGLPGNATTTVVLQDSLYPTCPPTSNSIFVPRRPAPVVSLGSNFDICGIANPTLTANITSPGSGGPYIYTWTPPQLGNPSSITIHSPGTYSVFVTDAAGCPSNTASVVVNNQLTAGITPATQCILPGATITAVPTPGGTYNYQWSFNGVPIIGATHPMLTVTAPGTYSVLITDNNTCSANASLTVNFKPNLTNVVVTADCQGNVHITGTADPGDLISITGVPNAPPPFPTLDGNIDVMITDVPNGSYIVTVTALNSGTPPCSTSAMVPIVVGVSLTNVSAVADCNANVTITGTADPGDLITITGIPNAPAPFVTDGNINVVISNVANGTYMINVQAANTAPDPNCITSVLVPVTVGKANVSATMTADCSGTVTITGVADANDAIAVSGDLSGSATADANGNFGFTFTGLSNGTYNVTITATNNTVTPACTAMISKSVTVGQAHLTNVTVTADCSGNVTIKGQADAGDTITITGIPNAPAPFVTSDGTINVVITNVMNGTYTVVVQANNTTVTPSCMTQVSMPVTVGQAHLAVNMTADCTGTITIMGMADPFDSIAITGDLTASLVADGNGNFMTQFTNLANNTYTVNVVATNTSVMPPCASEPAIESATVHVAHLTIGEATGNCIAGTVTIIGTADGGDTITVSGDLSGGTIAQPNGNYEVVITGVPNGTYSLLVTANNGSCATSLPVMVSVGAKLINVDATGDCLGTVRVTGVSDPGDAIAITGDLSCSTMADINGNFSCTIGGVNIGTYNLTVTATNNSVTPPCTQTVHKTVVVPNCAILGLFTCGLDCIPKKKVFTFTVNVRNTGQGPAENVVLTDVLPSCFTLVSAQGAGWTVNTSGQTITSTRPRIEINESTQLVITVRANCCKGQDVTNNVSITSATASPNATSFVGRVA